MGEVIISGGTLYGTTTGGGAAGDGVLYSISTNGTGFQTLYTFTGGNDGSTPKGSLTLGGNVLYGTTTDGGTGTKAGSIFSYTLPSSGLPSPVSLTITLSGTNALLTWPSSYAGYTLQFTPKLNPPITWSNVSPSAVIINNFYTATNSRAGAARFYRLSQ